MQGWVLKDWPRTRAYIKEKFWWPWPWPQSGMAWPCGQNSQCGILVTVIGHQCITLTIEICVQHGGCEAICCSGLSAAVETCVMLNLRDLTAFNIFLS